MTSPIAAQASAASSIAHRACPDERIDNAQRALETLDATVRALPNGAELADALLRREAVASAVLDGWTLTLRDLFLLDRQSEPLCMGDTVPDGPVDAGIACASRYLAAVEHGRRQLEAGGPLTGAILVELLTRLSGSLPRQERCIPPSVALAIAGIDAALRRETTHESAIVAAAVVRDGLARACGAMEECAALRRVATLLVLSGADRRCVSLAAPAFGELRDAAIALSNDNHGPASAPECTVANECTGEHAVADSICRWVADSRSVIERVTRLTAENEQRIGAFSQAAHSARRVHLALQREPVISLPRLLQETGLRAQAATSALHRLRALGIVREITGRQRHRVYTYDAYLALLGEGLAAGPRRSGGTLSDRRQV